MKDELPREAVTILEQMMDKYDLISIITGLSYICSEKSEHVAVNWQDVATAKQWMHRSLILDRCHVQLEELVD